MVVRIFVCASWGWGVLVDCIVCVVCVLLCVRIKCLCVCASEVSVYVCAIEVFVFVILFKVHNLRQKYVCNKVFFNR